MSQLGKRSDVDVIPVRAFRLAPDGNRGLYSLDGELIPTEPIQVEAVRGVLRVYGCEKTSVSPAH